MSETTEQYTEQGFDGHEAERTADSLWSADLGRTVTVRSIGGVIATGTLTGIDLEVRELIHQQGRRDPVHVIPDVRVTLEDYTALDLHPGSVVRFE